MRRVLMVSPHFPPDTNAATHRVRLLAPHLPARGWEPTVVAVDPRDYEGRLDPALADLVPPSLRVVHARAWPASLTRRLGIGALGLRAFTGLLGTCAGLLRRERFDALFVTIYPAYPALLGPWLKRRFGVPFVLDYQDPWVGAWGETVGGGAGVRETPCADIPLGGEPADFDALRRQLRSNPWFDPKDGQVHLCYVGTLLPLGFETLRAVLEAAALLGSRRPDLYARLRLHFFGTSNVTTPGAPWRVLPVARALGVADRVTEMPGRLDYLDALTVQTQASAILLMGSSERHYTASKLYPALLSERPLFAVYHEASSVVDVLRGTAASPTARVVTYGDADRAGARVEAIYDELAALVDNPRYDPGAVHWESLREWSAGALAGKLAALLDRVGVAARAGEA